MTAETFLKRAKAEISADPNTRFTPLVKSAFESKDYVIDIHTHVFDKRCLSIRYIVLRMLKSLAFEALGLEAIEGETENLELLTKEEEELYAEIEQGVDDDPEDWAQLESELDQVENIYETYELFGLDLKEARKVLKKKNMKEVLDFYHSDYAITNLPEFEQHKMVTGILQMDLETGWGFKARRNFKQQIKDLKEITKYHAVIPFLALDPRRVDTKGDDNLYKLFLDVFTDSESPFFGVKCYPALGFLPSDFRLDPIFQICAEKKIPVLTHCGGETVSTFKKKIEIKDEDGYKTFEIPGDKRKDRARYLNEPEHWIPVLEKYPDLKLNLGHFGGDDFWLEFSTKGANARIAKIYQMMRNPNWKVYGDFSFNLVEEELFEKFKFEMDANPEIAKRNLYGTDYWVVLPAGELLKEQEKFLLKLHKHKNAMLKDNVLEYLIG